VIGELIDPVLTPTPTHDGDEKTVSSLPTTEPENTETLEPESVAPRLNCFPKDVALEQYNKLSDPMYSFETLWNIMDSAPFPMDLNDAIDFCEKSEYPTIAEMENKDDNLSDADDEGVTEDIGEPELSEENRHPASPSRKPSNSDTAEDELWKRVYALVDPACMEVNGFLTPAHLTILGPNDPRKAGVKYIEVTKAEFNKRHD
jgi:hypothetical protein